MIQVREGSFSEYVQKCVENPREGYSYPYVSRNQNISEDEIQRAWSFFNNERKPKFRADV